MFLISVSFIKKAGLVLLFKDIEAAVERGLQREDSQMENVEDGNSPGKGRLGSGRGLRK